MTPDEVFFETVIESLRSLECEWQGKLEYHEALADSSDRVHTQEDAMAAHTYRLCIKLLSERRDRFSALYERLHQQEGPYQLAHDLTALLNRHGVENTSNTPDFLLAEFLLNCLSAWNLAMTAREKWYGRQPVPADPPPVPVVGMASLRDEPYVQDLTRRMREKLDAEAMLDNMGKVK